MLRVAVLLFQTVWLNAIVPGHRRGAVALPGEECAACKVTAPQPDACCPDMADETPAKPAAPTSKDPVAHCAICYFAAMLSTPPAVEWSPPAHRLLEISKPPVAAERPSLPLIPSYDGRAPPAGSFQLA
ncbi:MAG TPA: hypothetical protein VGI81_07390 [Tepidisphaeraceae bacterium]